MFVICCVLELWNPWCWWRQIIPIPNWRWTRGFELFVLGACFRIGRRRIGWRCGFQVKSEEESESLCASARNILATIFWAPYYGYNDYITAPIWKYTESHYITWQLVHFCSKNIPWQSQIVSANHLFPPSVWRENDRIRARRNSDQAATEKEAMKRWNWK